MFWCTNMLARIEPNKKEAQDPSKCFFFRLIKQLKEYVFFLSNIAKGAAFVHQGVRNCFVAFL